MSSTPPPDKDPQKQTQVNRRRSARLPPRQGISCTILESEDSTGHFVQVIDISQSGIRILTHQRYEAGTQLLINLFNAADLFNHRAAVIVRFAVGTSDGSHVTGCEFVQSLTYDHLRALLA
jgi:hypothetical protein